MTTSPGEIITRNQMTGTEQPDQILFPTNEIGGCVSIANTLRNNTENRTDPTIQITTVHLKQVNRPRKSDRNHFSIGSLNNGIDVPRPGQIIDNQTGMNPHVPIVTTILESNISNNYEIFDLVIRTLDISCKVSPWNEKIKSGGENLVENLTGKK